MLFRSLSKELYDLALKKQSLIENVRSGKEKLKTHPLRPRKTLKNLYQELDIPPWQRQAKILFLENEVLAVAGIGVNIDLMTQYGQRVCPVFVQDL